MITRRMSHLHYVDKGYHIINLRTARRYRSDNVIGYNAIGAIIPTIKYLPRVLIEIAFFLKRVTPSPELEKG